MSFKRKEQKKDLRRDIAMKSLRDSLSREELIRIKAQREFDEIEPGTFTYKLALHLDSLRKQFRIDSMLITKRLWNIKNLQNHTSRLKVQLASGEITELLKDGITMTKPEVVTQVQLQEWTQLGEVRAVAEVLASIRGLVGHIDVAKQVVLTNDQYEKYVGEIQEKLKQLGYNLFD